MSRPVHGIDQKDVLPTVVIVIDEADATAHGFWQILLSEGAGVVFEANTGLSGDVGELDRPGGTRRSNGVCAGLNWHRGRGMLGIGRRRRWVSGADRCGCRLGRRRFFTSRHQRNAGNQAQHPAASRSGISVEATCAHYAATAFAEFSRRESNQISTSMAAGPTMKSA